MAKAGSSSPTIQVVQADSNNDVGPLVLAFTDISQLLGLFLQYRPPIQARHSTKHACLASQAYLKR